MANPYSGTTVMLIPPTLTKDQQAIFDAKIQPIFDQAGIPKGTIDVSNVAAHPLGVAFSGNPTVAADVINPALYGIVDARSQPGSDYMLSQLQHAYDVAVTKMAILFGVSAATVGLSNLVTQPAVLGAAEFGPAAPSTFLQTGAASVGTAGLATASGLTVNSIQSVLTKTFGSIGAAIGNILQGNFGGALQDLITPPSQKSSSSQGQNPNQLYSGGGSGGGIGLGSGNTGQAQSNTLVYIGLGVGAVVLIWLYLKRKA